MVGNVVYWAFIFFQCLLWLLPGKFHFIHLLVIYASACSGFLISRCSVTSGFLTAWHLLSGKRAGSFFRGYETIHWFPTFLTWTFDYFCFSSLISTDWLRLSAAHRHGVTATPIASVVQKSDRSEGIAYVTWSIWLASLNPPVDVPKTTHPRGEFLDTRCPACLFFSSVHVSGINTNQNVDCSFTTVNVFVFEI